MKPVEKYKLLTFVLINYFSAQALSQEKPEIQIVFPDQYVEINGEIFGPQKGVLISKNNNITNINSLDLSSYFEHDSTQVEAFTLVSRGGLTSLAFTASQWDGVFGPSMIYECTGVDSCDEYSVPVQSGAKVKTLGFLDWAADYTVSFDRIFSTSNNDFFSPNNVYIFSEESSTLGQNSYLDFTDESVKTSRLNAFNILDPTNMAGIVYYENNWNLINDNDLSTTHPSEIAFNGVVESDLNLLTQELANKIRIKAYASADVGVIASCKNEVVISENIGTLTIPLRRVNGDEHSNSVRVITNNGSATQNVNYMAYNALHSWAHLDSGDQYIDININDIPESNGDTDFEITLQISSNPSEFLTEGFSLIANDSTVINVTILDDDGDNIFKNSFEAFCVL